MIQAGMVNNLENWAGSSGLGIGSAIDQARDTGVDEGASAHGTGFNGRDQYAAYQTMVSQSSSSLAQGHNFSVSCWIFIQQVAIMAPTDDFAILDY
jgi:hypothetical protein